MSCTGQSENSGKVQESNVLNSELVATEAQIECLKIRVVRISKEAATVEGAADSES